MADTIHLSWTSALILHTVALGQGYGYEVMDSTGLPSGTIYPALRRLEGAGLLRSEVESEDLAFAQQRPARRYYRLTAEGDQTLARAGERYPLLRQLVPGKEAP